MPSRHNKKGRSTTSGKFVLLEEFLLASPAYRALRPIPRALLTELYRIYNGHNNGYLALSARVAGDRCNVDKDTAARAFQELVEKGFIERACLGAFSRKCRHATEYRLTAKACDRTGALPSKTFMKWRPIEQRT